MAIKRQGTEEVIVNQNDFNLPSNHKAHKYQITHSNYLENDNFREARTLLKKQRRIDVDPTIKNTILPFLLRDVPQFLSSRGLIETSKGRYSMPLDGKGYLTLKIILIPTHLELYDIEYQDKIKDKNNVAYDRGMKGI